LELLALQLPLQRRQAWLIGPVQQGRREILMLCGRQIKVCRLQRMVLRQKQEAQQQQQQQQ
jgi:hypothetical protein